MTDTEPIEGEFDVVSTSDDEEYALLPDRLRKEFPPVEGKGFDFSQIKGTLRGRTAKAIILHLSCIGWSAHRLANKLGMAPMTVSRFLSDAIREAAPPAELTLVRRHELMKLDAYEQACHGELNDPGAHYKTGEPLGKNPVWLGKLLDIAKRRASLLGLDVPTKVEVDKTEKKLIISEVVVRSREGVEAARDAGLLGAPEARKP